MARNSLGKGLSEAGLGEGLAALFGEEAEDREYRGKTVSIAKIEPREGQPRASFNEETLSELAESIEKHGMLQPITVRETSKERYEIIAGERRWRAARKAGLTEIPVNIIDATEEEAAELALVENLQREDLTPVEEARGYKALIDNYGLTQERVAEAVGKSRPVIANAVRLLKLPEEVLSLMDSGKLTLSHARCLLELEKSELQSEAAKIMVEKNLTVREANELIKKLNSGEKGAGETKKSKNRVSADGIDYYSEIERELTENLGRRVKISTGHKKGKFEIEYYNKEDFENLYAALKAIGGTKNEA